MTKNPICEESRLHLLSLPYEIRRLIYQSLFPAEAQIYIQVDLKRDLFRRLAAPSSPALPTELLQVSQQLNAEASEFLYGEHLFNVIGTKRDCLAAYEALLFTMRRCTRGAVHVEAFSNGAHSQTMCISLYAEGRGKAAMVERRQRGVKRSIDELRREIAPPNQLLRSGRDSSDAQRGVVAMALVAVVVGVVAMALSSRPPQMQQYGATEATRNHAT